MTHSLRVHETETSEFSRVEPRNAVRPHGIEIPDV